MQTERRPTKVLLIDDDEDYFLVVRDLLLRISVHSYELEWVADYNEARKALLGNSFDVCLLDYCLGAKSGLELLKDVISQGCSIPVIVVTGLGDYAIDLESMRSGAADYFSKEEINATVLERSLRRSIERFRRPKELTPARDGLQVRTHPPQEEEFERVVEALRRGEERFRELAENIRDVFWVADHEKILYLSPAYEEIWSRRRCALYEDPGSFMDSVHQEDRKRVLEALTACLEGKARFSEEYRIVRPDGSLRWIKTRSFPVTEQGRIVRHVGIAEDVTILKEAEEALRFERDLAFQLASAGTRVEAMEYLLNASLKLDGLDSGAIFVVERETGALKLICHQGLSVRFVESVSLFESSTPLAKFVMRGEPAYWSHPFNIFELGDLLQQERFLAAVVLPVHYEGRVVASLYLASHVQSEISRNVRSTLEVIAAHIGGTVSRVTLVDTIKAQGERLREANAAFRVLLNQREEDREELEESILANVSRLILPYLEKLKKSRLGDNQKLLIEIMESHLNEITSPFVRRASTRFLGLSPTEIRISELIRQGRTSKEIAELLGLSERTILFHRQRIRGKLGLKRKKLNLQAYLASLTD